MAKMRFADKLRLLFGKSAFDDEFWDDLSDSLIEGDLGAAFAVSVTEELRSRCSRKRVTERASVIRVDRDTTALGASCSLRPEAGRLAFSSHSGGQRRRKDHEHRENGQAPLIFIQGHPSCRDTQGRRDRSIESARGKGSPSES
jgi:hypothetical protein